MPFTVPPFVVTTEAGGRVGRVDPELDTLVAGTGPPLAFGAARTNAEGGSPPIVSASAAFTAYGTATKRDLGCSGSVPICTANHRPMPLVKISAGRPCALLAPN